MENSKYYTPNLEEFYIGFEYLWRVIDKDNKETYLNKTINKWTFYCEHGDTTEFERIEYNLNRNIKVKYLDKEDIESLGWKKCNEWYYKININVDISNPNTYTLNGEFASTNEWSMFLEDKNQLIILDCNGDYLFKGIVKNKSELIKLLKQLRIN